MLLIVLIMCQIQREAKVRRLFSEKGFTLVEMIVVMAFFVVIIAIAGDSFNKILTQSLKLSKVEESNIEGVLGLEMFRHDLETAGFGLPTSYDDNGTLPTYKEAGYAPANLLNDAPSGVPRAVAFRRFNLTTPTDSGETAGNSFGLISGTTYVTLKGMGMSRSGTAGRWTYVSYSSTGSKPPKVWASDNLTTADRVVILRRTFSNGNYKNQLVYDAATPSIYWQDYDATGFVPAYSPQSREEILYVYGVAPKTSSNHGLGMPFNRADYFIAAPQTTGSLSTACAPGTGILYKATVNHETNSPGGKLNYMPLVDCVADMQVVIGWDLWDATNLTSGQDGIIDTWSSVIDESNAVSINTSGTVSVSDIRDAMASAETIRNAVKIIKIYILVQNGRFDPNYQSPATMAMGEPGELSLTRTYNLAALRNYRWKRYLIVARPKNLVSNQ